MTRTTPWRSLACIGLAALLPEVASAQSAAGHAPLSSLDRLVIEDDIRQQLALYPLLADGDGVAPKDMAVLAEQLMTPDVQIDAYPAGGGPPRHMSGRGALTGPKPPPGRSDPKYSRHLLVDTRFDSLTPEAAHTRTIAVQFVTAAVPAGAPSGAKVYSWVYHFDWRRTADGWRISRVALRNDP